MRLISENAAAARLVDNRVFHAMTGIARTSAGRSVVRDNTVRHTRAFGLTIFSEATRISSNVVRSDLEGSDGDTVHSRDNALRGNDFRGHDEFDRTDFTGPTAETVLNTWIDNLGFDPSPEGICTAP